MTKYPPLEWPRKRWLRRGQVIAILGSWRELARLEGEGLIGREYPFGTKQARYRTAQLRAAVEEPAAAPAPQHFT